MKLVHYHRLRDHVSYFACRPSRTHLFLWPELGLTAWKCVRQAAPPARSHLSSIAWANRRQRIILKKQDMCFAR